jgi:hypothetical protein
MEAAVAMASNKTGSDQFISIRETELSLSGQLNFFEAQLRLPIKINPNKWMD